MIARKENKEYTINEHQKATYLKDGYDIYDEKGKVVEYSPKKTITYNEHVKIVAELNAQIEELKSKVGVENVGKSVENTGNAPAEPSYAELKEKATALGITFKGNVSKAELITAIEDAEKAAATPPATPDGKQEDINPDPEGDE